ncbi:restriction endonuclease family protein [Thermoanaerobacterium thermosaccharolyticum]|uniref:site-specific DNA-methyltransferase (adenine-specific) n=1 Tax=Thermoanaerobacterium thermosaccharolyticum TaxID=1517 RepID=A0A223HZW6_THETR|nr:N-6 DNA methylase [Thermoanaerobacterium thermosaccharolyticum]AST58020.1 restriction endonuclease family protein [Thermoanaerobacterium thermosaccharolyticum]
MEEAVRFNKDALIDELKQIHKDMVSVYTELFTYKYENNEDFRDFIEKEYRENGIGNDGKDKWNENFCHRTSYTLINKVLFIRICEDKGFMFNPEEDFIMGEPKDPNIGKKLSARGRDKWISLISNYTFGELLKFAFADMKESFKNIALFKEDKYEKLNPTKQELELKFMLDSKEYKKTPIYSYEENVAKIIEKLDTSKFDFNVPAEGNILGDVYEKFMDRETRKAIGQFYTPDFVIEYILNNTVAEADVVENPFVSVLDPACGSGHFLIMAYDILRKKFEENIDRLREKYADVDYVYKNENMKGKEYWVKDRIHYHILKHCIFGADIDSFAVQLTTINLLLKDLDNFTDELNIMECDSLIKWEEDYDWQDLKQQLKNISMFYTINYKDINGIHRHDTLSRDKAEELVRLCEFWAKKYDYVVGNPPYGSTLNNEIKEKLKQNYPIIEGKNDIYALFLYRSINKVKDGMFVGMITPNTFLGLFYYEKLREFILNNVQLISIVDLPNKLNVFDGVNIDTVITIIKNCNISSYEYKAISKFDNLNEFINKQYKYEIINSDNIKKDNRILISQFVTPRCHCLTFDDVCTIHQGGAFVGKYGQLSDTDLNSAPYLSGTDIDRYFLKWKGKYIPLDKNKVYSLGNEEHYKKDKIVMQRSRGRHLLRRIVAAKDTFKFYCALGRTNYILSKGKNLNEILGVLNSKYINYYYTEKFGFSSTDIIADSLKQLPYPFKKDDTVLPILVEELIDLYEKLKNIDLVEMLKNCNNILESFIKIEDKKCNIKKRIEELENFIDIYIYNAFCLSVQDVLIVERHQLLTKKINFEKSIRCRSLSSINNENDYKNMNNKIYTEALEQLSANLKVEKFLEEHINNNKSLEQIAQELNYEYTTVALLRDKYVKEYGKSEPWRFYNLSELYNAINEYIKNGATEILKINQRYMNLNDIRSTLEKLYSNFEELMNIMRKDKPTKKSKDIVKEALNQFADTWNSYIKNINAGKEPKKLVKYYDSTYYGLSEWDDEIHKEYFIDAIKKYTEINPNEKKARDILKLFEGLNIKDKEDYIEIFNSQIKKAFRK